MSLTRRNFLELTAAGLATFTSSAQIVLGQKKAAARVRVGVPDWNLRLTGKTEAVELAGRLGFEGVEVSLGVGDDALPLADKDLQKTYLAESSKHGVAITSTCLNILHRNYLKSDPLGQRWVRDSIGITRDLGARVILLPFFGKGALKTREERDFVSDFLKAAAPDAERAGIILGLENENSAEENVYMLERIQSPAVKVYYDVGNSTRGGYDVVKEIRWLGRDRICQFHLKDNPHLLGQGKIDFPAIVEAIKDIKYSGWANLETESPNKDISKDLPANLAYIRNLLA
ncbi:MAG TPA: sugar phosphate isomerase/epimerase family protein [Acidobacteriota bacterium]